MTAPDATKESVHMIDSCLLKRDDVLFIGTLAPNTGSSFSVHSVKFENGSTVVEGHVISGTGPNVDKLPRGTIELAFAANSFVAVLIKDKERSKND